MISENRSRMVHSRRCREGARSRFIVLLRRAANWARRCPTTCGTVVYFGRVGLWSTQTRVFMSGHQTNEVNRCNVAVRRIAAATCMEELGKAIHAKCIINSKISES